MNSLFNIGCVFLSLPVLGCKHGQLTTFEMNIVPDSSNKMEVEPHTGIPDSLDQCARVQLCLGLGETIMNLTDGDEQINLTHTLSSLHGWCPNTKPDQDQQVKLHHISVKELR